MASGDSVEQIKERLDIVEVVGPYVELKPAGKSLKGRSPFTNEKTPSFFVSPERGMYYCFSTNQGGDIFTFVEKMEGVDFKGALKILADKAGVELIREDPKKRTERDNQYAVLEAATVLYENELTAHTAATTYVTERGVTGLTAKQWRLGYAPDEWRAAKMALEAKRHTVDTLRTVGLVKGEAGKDPYDVFRDRVMFPIFDPSGRVIAFSGRLLGVDSQAPKYVNSPESPLFKKSEALYGYHRAKEGIRKMNFSLIVEGQFDVVLAHQAGYHNTVAVSGTALSAHHVTLLQRLSQRCVLALDADRAGIAAVKKAATLMLARGMDVKVAHLPEGEDPADIIRTGVSQFKQYIAESTHVIEFLLRILKEQHADPRTYKLAVREEVLPYVQLIPNYIDQEHFVAIVATALDIDKTAIRLELTRMAESTKLAATGPTQEPSTLTPEDAPLPAANRLRSVTLYLQAAHMLLEASLQTVVAAQFNAITGTDITDVGALSNDVNQLSFQLEEQLAAYSPQQIKEEVRDALEELRQLQCRTRLRELRSQLGESAEEDLAVLSLIEEVKQTLVTDVLTTDGLFN